MNRRDFIRSGCTACLSIAVVTVGLQSCSSTHYIPGKLVQDGLVISKSDFKISNAKDSAYRNYIIIRNDALRYPVCIYRLNENEYSALWMQCSHQGAELQASGDTLQCPAHGSEFNNKGEVSNGPAAANLRTFPVKVSNTEIFIDLRKQS